MNDFEQSQRGRLETLEDVLEHLEQSGVWRAAVRHEIHALQAKAEQHDRGQLEILRQMGDDRQVLVSNQRAIAAVQSDTGSLVEFFRAMGGAFKLFNWLGMAAKPFAAIVAAVLAAIAAWKAMRP